MKVAILGASGYVGGELLRILLFHPKAELCYVTARRYIGLPVYVIHPNLRKITDLKFEKMDISKYMECDFIFLALPHGSSMEIVPQLIESGIKVIDLSADYRLKDPKLYETYYKTVHKNPDFLKKAIYGLPELHREEIRKADLVACPGCIAISIILTLAPAVMNLEIDLALSDVKIGSSGAGTAPTISTHHSERAGIVRAYKLLGHRHIAEIEQELFPISKKKIEFHMSAHAVDMIRGILSTNYLFLKESVKEQTLWEIFRSFYGKEPFIRVFKARRGVHRLADPKSVIGSNFCDISFEVTKGKIIIVSAIDNLVKGAAGNAVQVWNLMLGIDERTGLEFPGLHPV